jgi:hypothetical protein
MDTTETATWPMPVDLATLRQHWLPPQPASTVTAALAGIRRIDELTRAAAARLDDYDRQARQRATALADGAIAGDDLDRLDVTLVEPGRDILAAAVEALRHARAVAANRHARAVQTDEVHLAWLAECKAITDEWEQARWADDKPAAMLAFMQRHQPERNPW